MRRKIKIESFSMLVMFILNSIVWLCVHDLKIELSLIYALDVWILLSYIFMFRAVRKGCGGINYITAWLLLSLPFYFSQMLFFYHNRDIGYLDNIRSIFNGVFSDNSIINAVFFTLDCLFVIIFFAIQTYGYGEVNGDPGVNEYDDSLIDIYNHDLKYMHIVGWIFLAFSIIPVFYYWIYAGTVGRTLGYSEMKAINATASRTSIIFYASIISGWFLPSIYMILISSKSKIEKTFAEILLASIALLIFRAGSRYRVIEIVVAYLLIDIYWIRKNEKIRYGKYVVIVGAVYVISTLIRLTRTGRAFTGLNSLSILSSILGDTGSTSMINCAAMEFIPQKLNFGYGISFIYGLAAVLPNSLRMSLFPGFQTDITGDTLTALSGVTWSSFGSSIIAEGYYNFGYFSLILMACYGVLLGSIVRIQKQKLSSISPCKFLLYIYICAELIFALRSEFSSCFRSIIYYVGIPVLIIKTLKYFKRK